jgi:hypothetical protein
MYIASRKTAVVGIPKCASRTLISAVGACYDISEEGEHFTLRQHQQKNPELELGVALIREPLDRLRSGVEYLLATTSRGGSVASVKAELLRTLKGGRPSHTSVLLYPQCSFLLCNVPAKLYRWSRIDLLTRELGITKAPPVINRTKKELSVDQVVSVFGDGFVRQFYALDFALYDSLCSTERGVVEVQSSETYIHCLRGEAP